MKIAILTANLGNFDTPVDPIMQITNHDISFHRFTDENFPPITGLTPRLQYRIPKLFGYEMIPGFDAYIWLDGSMSFTNTGSVNWFVEKLGESDAAFFTHPWRKTIKEEVDHIEEKLQEGNEYITIRYKNGLHKEQYALISNENDYIDDKLYTSTCFIYRNTERVHEFLETWWFYQSRFFTCDQVALPFAMHITNLDVAPIQEHQFKNPYVTLVSHHK